MRKKSFHILGATLVVFLLAVPSSGWSEDVDSSGDLMDRDTSGLGLEINEDPLVLRQLFGLPPDFAQEIDDPKHPPRSARGWLGITIKEGKPVFLPGAKDVSPTIEVLQVFPHSPAETMELRPGDRIVAIQGEPLSLGKQNSLLMNFRHRVQHAGTGQPFEVSLFRDKKVVDRTAGLQSKPTTLMDIKPHSEWDAVPLEKDSLLHRVLRRKNLLEDYGLTVEEIRERTAQVVSTAVKGIDYNPFRLREINSVLNQPMDLPLVAQQWVDHLSEPLLEESLDLSRLIEVGMEGLDFQLENSKSPPAPRAGSLEALIDRILFAIRQAETARNEILSNLSPDEIEFLDQEMRRLAGLDPANQTDSRVTPESESRQLRFLELALKVDLEKLLFAAWKLARVLDVGALQKFQKKVAEFSPFRNDWVVEDRGDRTLIFTPNGTVIVGGTEDNRYTEDAALIVDLGGNDQYLNSAGSGKTGHPFAVTIDFSGNDLYLSDQEFSQGAGFFGGGFLIDLDGDDRYLSRNFAQGSAFFGVGLLVDMAGNDEYRCHGFCQGSGFFGIGLLIEGEGNDQYHAAIYSQGFGFVKGFGSLVEGRGDDTFFAGGVYPDHREPGKAYQSMSQGYGLGVRPWESVVGASGGIGVLADDDGNDTYIADYFSQGSSYWLALGILADRAGHDKYIAGRYSQGAGIHLSAGALIDGGGDDEYVAHFGVSQGCGHDLAVGFLLDNGGDDRYIAGVISQGAGNANGIGVLNDNGGADEYHIKQMGQGRGHFVSLRDLGSFGFLVDTGGDTDFYSRQGANNKISLQTEWGFLVDIK